MSALNRRTKTPARPHQIRRQLDAIRAVRVDDMADAYHTAYELSYEVGAGDKMAVQNGHSDPTADIAADREALRNRLRGLGDAIERAADLLSGAQADLDKLAGLDAVNAGKRQLHRHTRRRRRRT